MWDSSAKTRNKKSRRGLRLWPLRYLSRFLHERKDRLLRGRLFLRTLPRWGGLIFIVYVLPNLMVIRILSHRRRQLMMPFSTETRLEHVGVVGPELGLLLGRSAALSVGLLCKNKKEGGSARASPVAVLMPKSAPPLEKR